MKKIICLLALAMIVVSPAEMNGASKPARVKPAEARRVHIWMVLAPFRVPLKSGMKRTDPNPPPPFTQWNDVDNWQNFLYSHGYHKNVLFDGTFGTHTHDDTVDFQNDYGLNPSGQVDQATYCKATKLGNDPLPPYPPRPSFNCP